MLSEDCPIDYKPDGFYTLKEFAAFNDWLKTHEFVMDDIPISHFERESDGRLVSMPQVPIEKGGPVGEIFGQLRDWNNYTEQHGVPTSSQGGFNFGAGTVRAPDVAFTPRGVYCALDVQQRRTFQGAPFSPTFFVEVDNPSTASKLNALTSKFKDTYFPAGVRLGWLIDPINKTIYTFMRESDGVVRRRPHQWYGDDGNPGVLRGTRCCPDLHLGWRRSTSSSHMELPYVALISNWPQAKPPAGGPHRRRISCPECDKTFFLKHKFLEHFQDDH